MEENSTIDSQRLSDELRAIGASCARSYKFWDDFTKRLLEGASPSLDLKTHYRNPKSPETICKEVHEIIKPVLWKSNAPEYADLPSDVREFYFKLILAVKQALDY